MKEKVFIETDKKDEQKVKGFGSPLKLSITQRLEVMEAFKNGEKSITKIAAKYGVCYSTAKKLKELAID